MAIIKCRECGRDISDQAFSCPNCGAPVNPQTNYYEMKRKIPGKGFGVAGLVLGIIGAVYSFMATTILISMKSGENDIERIFKSSESIRSQGQTCMILGFYCIILGILSLIFGIVSYNKGYKKGICTSAIILGIVTIVFSIVVMATGSQTISSTYG